MATSVIERGVVSTESDRRARLTPGQDALYENLRRYAGSQWLSPLESEAFAASAELVRDHFLGRLDLTSMPHTRTLIAMCVGGDMGTPSTDGG